MDDDVRMDDRRDGHGAGVEVRSDAVPGLRPGDGVDGVAASTADAAVPERGEQPSFIQGEPKPVPNGGFISGMRNLAGEELGPAFCDPFSGCGDGDSQGTPLWLFRLVSAIWAPDCDIFASHENALCPYYHTLESPWTPRSGSVVCWANPPYSRGAITAAMELVVQAADSGRTVVCLTRLDPGADWFDASIWARANQFITLDTRLKYRGQSDTYPFPNCLSVFHPEPRLSPLPQHIHWRVRHLRPRGAI